MPKMMTKAHHKVFRAVTGAVINVADHHPDWGLDVTIARSIAKRATGTIVAEWTQLLAESSQSVEDTNDGKSRLYPPLKRSKDAAFNGRAGIAASRYPPHLYKRIVKQISGLAGEARRNNNQERLAVLIEVLRIIHKIRHDQP